MAVPGTLAADAEPAAGPLQHPGAERQSTPVDASRHADEDADQFFEMSLDHLVVAGFDGYFRRLNPAWTRTFGWTHAELLAKPSLEFVHPLDREATLSARRGLLNGIALTNLTNRYLCKDGSYRWLHWMSATYPDRGLIYAAARDVTDQRQAELASKEVQGRLILAERMATVGRVASGVAHEINNPLTAVMANLEMVIADLRALEQGNTPRLHELADQVAAALAGAEEVRNIVRKLKTLARTDDEDQGTVTVIRTVVDLSVDLVAHEFGAHPLRHAQDRVRQGRDRSEQFVQQHAHRADRLLRRTVPSGLVRIPAAARSRRARHSGGWADGRRDDAVPAVDGVPRELAGAPILRIQANRLAGHGP